MSSGQNRILQMAWIVQTLYQTLQGGIALWQNVLIQTQLLSEVA